MKTLYDRLKPEFKVKLKEEAVNYPSLVQGITNVLKDNYFYTFLTKLLFTNKKSTGDYLNELFFEFRFKINTIERPTLPKYVKVDVKGGV